MYLFYFTSYIGTVYRRAIDAVIIGSGTIPVQSVVFWVAVAAAARASLFS